MIEPTLRRSGLVLLVALVSFAASSDVAARMPHGEVAGSPNDGALVLRWVRPVGAQPEYVLADRIGVVSVTRRGRVMALGRGARARWSRQIALADDEGIFGDTASVGRGLVVVPAGEARIVALDRASGALRWEAPMPTVRATAVGHDGTGGDVVAATDRAGTLAVLDGADGIEQSTGATLCNRRPRRSLSRVSGAPGRAVPSLVNV